MYQQQKRYNTTLYRLSDFKLGKLAWRRNYSGKGLAWLGRPQVAMHSQLPRLHVKYMLLVFYVNIATQGLQYVKWPSRNNKKYSNENRTKTSKIIRLTGIYTEAVGHSYCNALCRCSTASVTVGNDRLSQPHKSEDVDATVWLHCRSRAGPGVHNFKFEIEYFFYVSSISCFSNFFQR